MDSIRAENISSGMTTWKLGINQSFSHNTSENSSSSTCIILDAWDWLYTFQPMFLWIIFVLGVIENGFVLSVLCFHKSRCTVAEIYLANLAVADLMLVCGLPFWAINIANQFKWPFGTFLCKVVNAIIYMNLYSSIYFLMMVSIDRYLALVKTMSLGRMRRDTCARWNCLVIWVSALLICSPVLVFRSVSYVEEAKGRACILQYPSTHWTTATHILLNTVGFLIPLCVITYCTIQIIKALRDNKIQRLTETQTEKRATILVLAVLLLFIICWLPFQVTTFIDILIQVHIISDCITKDVSELVTQVATYCAYSNSCLNPVLYVIVGKQFRKKSRELYKCCLPRMFNKSESLQMENSLDTLRTSISIECPKKKSASSLAR
ncbi:B2 bradykinin receptor-like [Malaclemys terrapin pileata]|uniref:B2 bradykinin receptor-like n=1 Tax=Malaclemys terrapin pileata TaxID=2991368 RepID=UPI0023A8A059|nr:B2 bradykinin receptor-like [Malaclemys terrapin pileata]XP_053881187.1 B2 bradykinin receptor-like [Malaclemys terrapin pileata]XP_053881188.1 B2 bradykinin receptor-like [Malaclemys terrapin pileata]XP_053881190.1 B2 bradykinin receptor-like [Malaclemys terrapin pileata]XP_053881191.1 B2 bradykinin receptor-like [Malaclemys terrapin pileata]